MLAAVAAASLSLPQESARAQASASLQPGGAGEAVLARLAFLTDTHYWPPSARRGQQSRLVVRTGLPEICARGTDAAASTAAPVLGESHRGLHSFLAPPLGADGPRQLVVFEHERFRRDAPRRPDTSTARGFGATTGT